VAYYASKVTRWFETFLGRQRKQIFLSPQKKRNTEKHRIGRHLEMSAQLPIAYSKISSA